MRSNRSDTPAIKRRWKPVVVGLAVLIPVVLLASLAAVYAHYVDPAYIRRAVERYVQQYTNGRVTIGRASFSWLDGVRLHDVALYEPGAAPQADSPTAIQSLDNAVFSCRLVILDTDLIASALGRLTIRSVVATEPTCSIVRNASDGSTNLAGLIASARFAKSQGPLVLPTIELRDARVRVIHRTDDRARIVDEQVLTVRGRPTARDSRYYDIVWQSGGSKPAQGCTQVDLKTGRLRNVFGGLPWMSLEAVMIVVNAENTAARTWSELLGLDGMVRAKDYNISGPSDKHGPRSATIELENAALSIPIDERELELPPAERYLRFEQVFGSVILTAEGIEASFRGIFHGSECNVSARLRGGLDRLPTLEDVDFTVHISAKDFELPKYGERAPPSHRRFVDRWAPIRKFYDRFDPHGRVDIEIEAERRAGADSKIVTRRVRMTARDASASYRRFPYRVEHLTGSVEYTPEGVFLRRLAGRHGDGNIEVDGWLSQPGRRAEADLTIKGVDVSIDDALITALPPGYREIYESFHPRGRIDATVRLRRGAYEDEDPPPWNISTSIAFDNLSAVYNGFPAPLRNVKGSLRVEGKKLEIRDLKGRIESGSFEVSGDVRLDGGRVDDLAISLTGRNVPFSDSIISSLPDSMQRWVRPFHPKGRFDVDMRLATENEKLIPAGKIDLHDVTIRHDDFPVAIGDINGKLAFQDGRIETDGLTGRYGEAELSVEAASDLTGESSGRFLHLRCRGLVVDDALRAAAPDSVRSALFAWRVESPVDVDVAIERTAGDGEPVTKIYVAAQLNGATVRHERFPLPFEAVRAKIVFDGEDVKAIGIRARYGTADVSADFQTSRRLDGEEGTISIDAVGLTLDASLLGVMPDGVRLMCDRLGLSGRVNLHFDRLRYTRTEKVDRAVWTVRGSAELLDVALAEVASLRGLQGTVTLDGTLVDQKGGTMLEGEIRLSELTLMDRRLTHVTAPWTFAQIKDGSGRFALDAVRGEIYEGALTGQVEVAFDARQTDYTVTVAVDGMDIEPFVNVHRGTKEGDAQPVNLRGYADARVHLSGIVGDPASRRGRGQIEIKNGHLFRLPIMLAILHVISLSLPDEDAFEDARADFYLVGQRMELQNILLRGNALALVGSGTLAFPDLGLDLVLAHISPNQWARIPVLTDLAEGAVQELVELHVTGPLYQPRVTRRPLPRLSDEFRRLFVKKKPKKMRAPPP